MEVEIEKMGGKMGNEHHQPPICNKALSKAPNERSEWPLPFQTCMRISLSRNWLTSRVSVHSPCKGQAIALQVPKGN